MQQINFEDGVTSILAKNPHYAREAYDFLREALEFTQKTLSRNNKTLQMRHITGQELLGGIREYGLAMFGPMAITVFEQWGVKSCEDFGSMVFLMVEGGLLRKTDQDSPDDFKNGYSFEEAFRTPFVPDTRKKSPAETPTEVEKN